MTRQRILGIDPGSQVTGFCLLHGGALQNLKDYRVLDAGVIRPKKSLSHSERVGHIHMAVHQLILEHQPSICVIEKGYTGINHNSALKLGETRGAIIAAARREDTPLAELSPSHVKKTVTGQGNASKELIADTLVRLLGFQKGSLPFDVTDAVAIALSYGITNSLNTRLERSNLNSASTHQPLRNPL